MPEEFFFNYCHIHNLLSMINVYDKLRTKFYCINTEKEIINFYAKLATVISYCK